MTDRLAVTTATAEYLWHAVKEQWNHEAQKLRTALQVQAGKMLGQRVVDQARLVRRRRGGTGTPAVLPGGASA